MTLEQIMAAFRSGEFSLEQALAALTKYLGESRGMGAEQAAAVAQSILNNEAEEESAQAVQAAAAPDQAAPAGARVTPGFDQLGIGLSSPFSGGAAGSRSTALNAVLGNTFPTGGGPGERAFERQATAIGPAFDILQGFGDLPEGASYFDFLSRNLGQSNIDPTFIAQRASDLVSGPTIDFATDPLRADLQGTLLTNPGLQQNIARQAHLQNIPTRFRASVGSQFDREFAKFQTSLPINQAGEPEFASNPFLPEFFDRRRRR